MTANVLKSAVNKYLAYCKEKKAEKAHAGPVKHRGKQSVKQLVGQDQGVTNIEITDKNIKDFERIARKRPAIFPSILCSSRLVMAML